MVAAEPTDYKSVSIPKVVAEVHLHNKVANKAQFLVMAEEVKLVLGLTSRYVASCRAET